MFEERRSWQVVLVATLSLMVAAPATAEMSPGRDVERENVIETELAALAPEAVSSFRSATVALDEGDLRLAEAGFREVLQQAPFFDAALRRLGSAVAQQGRRDQALSLVEGALELRRSPSNLYALGLLLAFPGDGTTPTFGDLDRAGTLLDEAIALDPGDVSNWAVRGSIAVQREDLPALRRVVRHMTPNFPEEVATHWLAAIRAASDGEWQLAEREIREAGRLGLPDAMVESFLASGVRSRAESWRWVGRIGFLSLLWAGGLVLLFVGGKVLSALTLRSVERDDPNGDVPRHTRNLRSLYRAVVAVAGIYWYVSLPFVALLVIALTVAVYYAFMIIGRIPIQLVAILGIGALVTIFAIVRSLFVRIRDDDDPGRAVTEQEAPGLWALAREVAAEVGTRPVDEIWLTPGTELAVFERGSMLARLRDNARRALILGAGVLEGLDIRAMRAVLAHEYGHFSHRDTAGGDIALRVQGGMYNFAVALAEAGYAVWWNLGFQFLRLYSLLYRRIAHGAIRLQEVLADRVAIQRYGLDAFREGLSHVVRRSIEFEHLANTEIGEAITSQRPVANLYALQPPADPDVINEMDARVRQALDSETTADDTHASPEDRFRLGTRIRGGSSSGPDGPVWALFQNPDSLKQAMHESVVVRVAQQYELVSDG